VADFSTHPDGAAAQPGADEATVRALREAYLADVEATPAARQEAASTGVDLTSVEGSGKDGRVTKADVDDAPVEPEAPTVAPAAVESVDPLAEGQAQDERTGTESQVVTDTAAKDQAVEDAKANDEA
jgi:pyruvate/2-oxoglutarate dehydrogenase complex dihydrolipoamide acyltransferase (E2) component